MSIIILVTDEDINDKYESKISLLKIETKLFDPANLVKGH